jgi:HlyD family secretion protein
MNDLVVVTAPADGVVLDVAERSQGSVVREAEPLVTIIPSNATLIAEIMINSSDVGYTKAGDDVVIKVDAFPYQRHGLLRGRLLFVSEESSISSSEKSGESGLSTPGRSSSSAFHRGRVELLTTNLDRLPEGARLIPGMTMSAEIMVGSRSVISYFLYPVTRGLSEAIREP